MNHKFYNKNLGCFYFLDLFFAKNNFFLLWTIDKKNFLIYIFMKPKNLMLELNHFIILIWLIKTWNWANLCKNNKMNGSVMGFIHYHNKKILFFLKDHVLLTAHLKLLRLYNIFHLNSKLFKKFFNFSLTLHFYEK